MLSGLRVLFVEDDEDSRTLIEMMLAQRGVDLRVSSSGEEALEIARTWQPDVVLADILLPGIDGIEMLRRLRMTARDLPAVALSGAGRPEDRARTLAGGFEKHLLKPTSMSDIVASLSTVAARRGELRQVLESVNATGACQFTSVLRFSEDGSLVSAWTYDRAAPHVDPFPIDMKVEASYCVLVRDSRTTTIVEDAQNDPRVVTHPKRDQLAAYLGVPLFTDGGAMFGTLCSYDVKPQTFTERERAEHEAAAGRLAPIVSRWGDR